MIFLNLFKSSQISEKFIANSQEIPIYLDENSKDFIVEKL